MWNLNIGVLGHVDSGKTSLCRALSLIASTAAFDKSPQSQERGITLDLGFSSRVLTAELDPLCAPYLEALSLASRGETTGTSNPGLSSVPDQNNERSDNKLCCTFVDCPGHATLIRTIVGGAQIIDVMILVIDATKGVQAQTAECLVIGEILARPLVVVINKLDSLNSHWEEKSNQRASEGGEKIGSTAAKEEGMASAALQKLRKKLTTMFSKTRWPHVEMIEVSAAAPCSQEHNVSWRKKEDEGDEEPDNNIENKASTRMPTKTINVEHVLPAVLRCAPLRELLLYRWKPMVNRRLQLGDGALLSLFHSLMRKENFLMLSDHCFAVRGHGTVFSGTVLQGTVEVGDTIWLPSLQVQKKVKSLQVFKKQVTCARRGDRVGLCVTQLDPSSVERGILCGCCGNSSSASGEIADRGGSSDKAYNVPCVVKKNVLKEKDQQQVTLSGTRSSLAGDFSADLGAPSLLSGVLLSPPRLAKVFIASVRRIRFHRLPCDTVTKFHIVLGHTTVMGTFRYFSRFPKKPLATEESAELQLRTTPLMGQATSPSHKGGLPNTTQWEKACSSFSSFSLHEESMVEEELGEEAMLQFSSPPSLGENTSLSTLPIQKGLLLPPCPTSKEYYAVALLEEPVLVSINNTFVAMRLDVQREGFCRIAMTGTVQYVYPLHPCSTTTPPESAPEFSWRALPVYRFKKRTLQVCRVLDAKSCIASGVIHFISAENGAEKDSHARHSEAQKFVGVPVYFVPFRALPTDPTVKSTIDEVDSKEENYVPLNTTTAVRGVIHSTFGKSGKVRLEFSQPIFVVENSGMRKKNSDGNEENDKCKSAPAKVSTGLEEPKKSGIPSSFTFLQQGEVVLEIRKSPFALHWDSLKDIRTH